MSQCFRRISKISKSDYWFRHVCLSVWPSIRMEHRGWHWINFCTKRGTWILCGNMSKRTSSLIKIWQNNRYFTWRPTNMHNHISLISKNKKYCKKNICPITFFLVKRAVYEIMWKNIIAPDHRRKYDACTLHAGYLRLSRNNNDYTKASYCYVPVHLPV
jgi:hypothetical protein